MQATTTTTPLTPAQQAALDGLLWDRVTARPHFSDSIGLDLRDELEAGLADIADRLGDEPMYVKKSDLGQVHACEQHHLAASESAFSWTPVTARGTLAHKAIELSLSLGHDAPALDLVDAAFERTLDDGGEWTPAAYLRTAQPSELAELRAEVNDVVVKWQECFPPLQKAWRPRVESSARVELCGGRIVLKSKVDLALGRPIGTQARVVIIDLKSGRAHSSHMDDLRFYALVETLRLGVPPFRVASFYLESARWQAEDVTEDLLRTTVRRVVDGVVKLGELRRLARPATLTPNGACSYCPLADTCEGAETWTAMSAARALGDYA